MKYSDAMEQGFKKIKAQCRGSACIGRSVAPSAVDANGAAQFAINRDAQAYVNQFREPRLRYRMHYGATVTHDNDVVKRSIPEIIARLRAIGD